ncbi:MAG: hypothetical protein IJK63_11165 [Oscillospiraceae bacterium]|nr:hypothetical protein [Oscillospiraceae bacterium]
MNGNLDAPWFYLFLSVFTFIVSLCLLILACSVLMPADDSVPGNAFEIQTSFSFFHKTGDAISLYAPGYKKPFAISWLSGYEVPLPDPSLLCKGDIYRVVVVEARSQYAICSVATADMGQIISAYDRNTAYRNTQFIPCICVIIMCAGFAVLSIFMILVGRYPEHFPGWFRDMFYNSKAWTSPAGTYDKAYYRRHRKR